MLHFFTHESAAFLFSFYITKVGQGGRGVTRVLLSLIRSTHKCSLAFHTEEWMQLLNKLDLLVCWPRPSCYPASCVLILEGCLKIKLRHLLLLLSAVIKSAQCYLSVENVASLAHGCLKLPLDSCVASSTNDEEV